ncbi:MAG: hypothetical protein IH808_05380 [Proteobacteria bacterium]|nr:hypothetical protein [Pseudomonadota bacterium]
MIGNRKLKIAGRERCDRRMKARRDRPDRRNMFRWEPQKDDRREGYGRRPEDQVWDAVQSMF